MPTYLYEILSAKGEGTGETFEVFQKMSDAALTRHPETSAPVRRVPQAPLIGGKHSSAREKRLLSDNSLSKMGFTKYVKGSEGYDKVVGKGPDLRNINKKK